jgi:hypothetical protein
MRRIEAHSSISRPSGFPWTLAMVSFVALLRTHTNPGGTGGMQASQGSICIFANEPLHRGFFSFAFTTSRTMAASLEVGLSGSTLHLSGLT